MDEINVLLNKRWIIRKNDPETYYKLKDQYQEYKSFFIEKLGYKILINPLLIKAEKVPGKAKRWMGIQAFKSPETYIFLSLILMFLEEMEVEEQCVLSEITDYIKNQYPGEIPVDWTVFSKRKKLIDVIKFCTEEGLIKVNDGDSSAFTNSPDEVEVLYENTGVSKYFMRRFSYDLSLVKTYKDFEHLEWQNEENERGIIRRHRVYRRLVMEPIVYQESGDDQDYLYIKNQRSVIDHDIEKYLGGRFHLHRNGALVLMDEFIRLKDCLPNRKNISDIVLQMCLVLRKKIGDELVVSETDLVTVSQVKWEQNINEVIETFGSGWSKGYREIGFDKLKKEINQTMVDFAMIRLKEDHNEVVIFPAVGKIVGNYSKDYWTRKGKK